MLGLSYVKMAFNNSKLSVAQPVYNNNVFVQHCEITQDTNTCSKVFFFFFFFFFFFTPEEYITLAHKVPVLIFLQPEA